MCQDYNKTVSIITPSYNVGKYIKDFFSSILAQTYKHWELIIIDDSSTDNTIEVINKETSGYENVRLIRRNINSGGCRLPRLQGIVEAKGDYICCIDSDDFIEEKFLEKLIQRQNETSCEIILGKMVFCQYNSIITGKTIPTEKFNLGYVDSGYEFAKLTIGDWQIAMNGMLVESNLIKGYANDNISDNNNQGFIDEIDHRNLLLKAKKVAMTDALYYYRMNPESITHKISFDNLLCYKPLQALIFRNYGKHIDVITKFEENLINTLFNSNTLFLINKEEFSKVRQREISELIKKTYELLDKSIIKQKKIKYWILASNFQSFMLISRLASYKRRWISRS